jgi:hypothetical protein
VGKPFSRRVVAAGVEGVAFADTNDAAKPTSNRAVLFDAFDKISTARWSETASRPEQGADESLIASNQRDQAHPR